MFWQLFTKKDDKKDPLQQQEIPKHKDRAAQLEAVVGLLEMDIAALRREVQQLLLERQSSAPTPTAIEEILRLDEKFEMLCEALGVSVVLDVHTSAPVKVLLLERDNGAKLKERLLAHAALTEFLEMRDDFRKEIHAARKNIQALYLRSKS